MHQERIEPNDPFAQFPGDTAAAEPGVSQRAKEIATDATGAAADVARTAADGTGTVAQTAMEEAMDVARVAKDQAREMTGEVAEQGRQVLESAREQARRQAEQQAARLAESVRKVGQQMQALLDGNPEQAGPLNEYVRQAQEKVQQMAAEIETRGYDGMIEQARTFARRRPGMFLAGAALAGFGIGRMLRSADVGGAGANDSQWEVSDDSGAAALPSALPSATDVPNGGDYGTSGGAPRTVRLDEPTSEPQRSTSSTTWE